MSNYYDLKIIAKRGENIFNEKSFRLYLVNTYDLILAVLFRFGIQRIWKPRNRHNLK